MKFKIFILPKDEIFIFLNVGLCVIMSPLSPLLPMTPSDKNNSNIVLVRTRALCSFGIVVVGNSVFIHCWSRGATAELQKRVVRYQRGIFRAEFTPVPTPIDIIF